MKRLFFGAINLCITMIIVSVATITFHENFDTVIAYAALVLASLNQYDIFEMKEKKEDSV